MVVKDDYIHTIHHKLLDLLPGGDAVIYSNYKGVSTLQYLLYTFLCDSIAFVPMGKPVGYILRSKLLQGTHHDGCTGDTVNIPVSKDEDLLLLSPLLFVKSLFNPFYSTVYVLYRKGTVLIKYVILKGEYHILLPHVPSCHDSCRQERKLEALIQGPGLS